MPYITENARKRLSKEDSKPYNAGELNYLITKLINEYINSKGLNYQTLNDALGALEGSKLELYRRVAVPYEDEKIEINGDVFND